MGFETPAEANAFAKTACKLVSEYIGKLIEKKRAIENISERHHSSRALKTDYEYWARRYMFEAQEYLSSKDLYSGLARKISQWLEHSTPSSPEIDLELRVRLSELEGMIRCMDSMVSMSQPK